MKYSILMILVALLSVLTSHAQSKSYAIYAKIDGLTDGTRLFLKKNGVNSRADTVNMIVAKDGKFILKGTETIEPEFYFLFLEGRKEYLTLLLENDRCNITGDVSKWPKLDIKGAIQHEEYEKMKSILDNNLTKANSLTNNEDKKGALKRYYEETVAAVVKSYPNSIYTPFLVRQLKRDSKDIHSEEKLKVYEDLTYYVKNSKYGRELLKSILTQAKREHIKEGAVMPDFEVIGLDGQKISASQIASQSKYTLIDFWASWCKPCRAQIPHLKEVYEEFKNKGFNILAVSSDSKEKDWKKAMAEDNTPWAHGLQIGKNANELFGIAGIPGYMLIDQQGKMIAYSITSSVPAFGPAIREAELVQTLKQLLK